MGGGYKGSQGRRELGLPRSLVESPRSSQRGSTVCYGAVDETDGLELEAGRDGEDRLPGSLAWSVGFQAESGWHLMLVVDTKSRGEGGRNLHRKSAESPGNGAREEEEGAPAGELLQGWRTGKCMKTAYLLLCII